MTIIIQIIKVQAIIKITQTILHLIIFIIHLNFVIKAMQVKVDTLLVTKQKKDELHIIKKKVISIQFEKLVKLHLHID